ncbi:putative toxin-antitoxin system toxin component, PIN family [Candidatus Woesearchaeota archaeon]|nr:putative toxin-antitoxin system toxin component, PIN family [Candidatus Woesearchaeota archaeon]
MISVVLDTNVIVSAAISIDGNPALIFEMLTLEEIKNYTTQEVIDEIREALRRPKIAKRISLVEQEFIMNTFEKFSEKSMPGVKFEEIKEDPDDRGL